MAENIDNLKDKIMSMAEKRGLNKTLCPSEVARQLAIKEEHWRSLMEPIRLAAAELIDKGLLVCKQNGKIVDIRTVKGPIRLQMTSN